MNGPGGHTSRPHKTVDVVSAASRVAAELPAAVRNAVDARSAVVTAFGSIHGGDAPNVIPTEVVLEGTVRTLDAGLWDVLPSLVDKILGSILGLSGAGYTLDYRQGIAPVVNDEMVVNRVTSTIRAGLGEAPMHRTNRHRQPPRHGRFHGCTDSDGSQEASAGWAIPLDLPCSSGWCSFRSARRRRDSQTRSAGRAAGWRRRCPAGTPGPA